MCFDSVRRMNESDEVTQAVTWFWGSRASQSDAIGHSQGGAGRDAVVGGQHLNAIRDLIANELIRLGVPEAAIKIRGKWKNMPGYFRPTKNWDLALVNERQEVVALFELKSMSSSYGNNANNRTEEAIANSVELQYAVEKGYILVKPWLAYVFLIRDEAKSRKKPSRRSSAAYPIDPTFANTSYVDRMAMVVHRLVKEGFYDAGWFVATVKPESVVQQATWSSPREDVSWEAFSTALQQLVARHFGGT